MKSVRHGLSKIPEYRVWAAMKRRCYNPNVRAYRWYGGRGIKVCQRWKENFALFLEDLGRRPPGGEIERRDNDGDYGPDNCFWSTRKAQMNNTSANHRVTVSGQTKTIAEWAELTNIPSPRIYARILKLGMSPEQALRPHKLRGDGSGKPQQTYTHRGKTMTLGEWAVEIGLSYATLWGRIFTLGWSIEKALSLGLQQ